MRRAGLIAAGRASLISAAAGVALATATGASATSASAKPLRVTWMPSVAVPGTPARYNKVGVLKIGPASAKNVLVLEPGTSAGSAYFAPLAQWLTSKLKGWQVWSIERRENLFEDQSMLTPAKEHKAGPRAVFNYYLGWLQDSSIKKHVAIPATSSVEFAKQWGVKVGVEDMHTVIDAARKLGGKVVLGGHSLGGAMVTAYATWDFNGKAGADGLAGLVYDDGASRIGHPTAQQASAALAQLNAPGSSPWLQLGEPAPYLGIFASTGALSAIVDPNTPSLGQTFKFLPANLNPPERVTNLALFAYNTNVSTSKLGIFAFLAHLGTGLTTTAHGGIHGWNPAGALTPVKRWAAMLAGPDVQGADGVEWYFPARLFTESLTDGAIDEGNDNPAQHVFGMKDTMGHYLPRNLLMYAFGAYGGDSILASTTTLARQSHIRLRNLTLVNRHATYAHNDPAGAYPNNAFFTHLVTFLEKIDRRG